MANRVRGEFGVPLVPLFPWTTWPSELIKNHAKEIALKCAAAADTENEVEKSQGACEKCVQFEGNGPMKCQLN